MTRITSPNADRPPRRRNREHGDGVSRGSDVLFYISISLVAVVLCVIICLLLGA
jgi:hypothetical protein